MQNVASGCTAKDSILVLQAHHVDLVEVQEFSRFFVRRQVILGERPPHPCGIVISFFGVVYRQCQQSSGAILRRYGLAQVRGECSDATLSRKIISDHRDSTRQRWLRLRSCARHGRAVSHHGTGVDDFQECLGKHGDGLRHLSLSLVRIRRKEPLFLSAPRAITRAACEIVSCQYSTQKWSCRLITIDHLVVEEHCVMSLRRQKKERALMFRCSTRGAKPGQKCELSTSMPPTDPHRH